ncbi:hypothetical protein BDZ91DRAFT_784621 [Kalaharituber pfeilii]|nr:hypothetical protein BDZ91DRAFT_784621 [Kalaharituber pfeilii]
MQPYLLHSWPPGPHSRPCQDPFPDVPLRRTSAPAVIHNKPSKAMSSVFPDDVRRLVPAFVGVRIRGCRGPGGAIGDRSIGETGRWGKGWEGGGDGQHCKRVVEFEAADISGCIWGRGREEANEGFLARLSPSLGLRQSPLHHLGFSISNTPSYTFVPTTSLDLRTLLKYAKAHRNRVHASSYLHSCADSSPTPREILVSMLGAAWVNAVPDMASFRSDGGDVEMNELRRIHFLGKMHGAKKAWVEIGAAVTIEESTPIENLQTVTDPFLLRDAAESFGLLGIRELERMRYSVMRPLRQGRSGTDTARHEFVHKANTGYYSQWIYFRISGRRLCRAGISPPYSLPPPANSTRLRTLTGLLSKEIPPTTRPVPALPQLPQRLPTPPKPASPTAVLYF